MDFLFLNHSASVEAIIVFLCLWIIFLFLIYDAYIWIKLKYRELHPRKAYVEEASVEAKNDSPTIPSPITLETIDEELKSNESPSTEMSILESSEEISSTNFTWDASLNEYNEESENSDNVTDPVIDIWGITWVDVKNEDSQSEITSIEGASQPQIEEISWTASTIVAESSEPEETIKSEEISSPILDDDSLVWNKEKISEEWKREEKPEFNIPKQSKKKSLSPEKKERVLEIINNAKTLIARGHIDEARALIVNGLSLEKTNRELNLLMAELYEREHSFEKAEFVLKELAEADPNDVEVLTHLATVVAMQRKFEVSYEIYKKILFLAWETEETLYTLTHIASELNLTEDMYTYSKSYLKQYPKNPEILWLYSQAQITKGERRWAIETLIKLKNLTPYNQEIVDLISKLVTEDELAGNFGEENV